MDYRFAIGTDDPQPVSAATDQDAIERTVAIVRTAHLNDLRTRPEAVLTLLGPNGLVTRPSERLDAFVERMVPANPAADPDRLQPGDSNTPDCNLD